MARRSKEERTDADKRADFIRLANKHAGTAVKAIQRLGGMAKPSRYTFTPDDIAKIKGVVTQHLEAMETRFAQPETSRSGGLVVLEG